MDNEELKNNIQKPTKSRRKAKVIFVMIVLIIIIGLGYRAVLIKMETDRFLNIDNKSEVTNSNNLPTPNIDNSDPEIISLMDSFSEVQRANNERNTTLYRQYISKKSLETFSEEDGWAPIWFKEIKLIKITKKDPSNIIITVSLIQNTGKAKNQDLLFIKEADGIWRIAL